MQLQIECNSAPLQQQSCLICEQSFKMAEAKIIVCNDQGKYYGEVCPNCLGNGFHWLSDRFNQIHYQSRNNASNLSRNRKIPVSIPAKPALASLPSALKTI